MALFHAPPLLPPGEGEGEGVWEGRGHMHINLRCKSLRAHTNISEYFPGTGFGVLPAVPGLMATFHD